MRGTRQIAASKRRGFNSRISVHATRSEAEAAARDMLGRIRAADSSVPWRACVANPHVDGVGSGKSYAVEEDTN